MRVTGRKLAGFTSAWTHQPGDRLATGDSLLEAFHHRIVRCVSDSFQSSVMELICRGLRSRSHVRSAPVMSLQHAAGSSTRAHCLGERTRAKTVAFSFANDSIMANSVRRSCASAYELNLFQGLTTSCNVTRKYVQALDQRDWFQPIFKESEQDEDSRISVLNWRTIQGILAQSRIRTCWLHRR